MTDIIKYTLIFYIEKGKNSMICNKKMKELLKLIDKNELPIIKVLPIWIKKNNMGESFWGTGNFCGCVGKKPTSVQGKDLTDLEWDGNETNINRWEAGQIDYNTACIILDVTSEALSVVKEWKAQLEKEYAATRFDIVLSIDEGNLAISPSATIRFYAVRDSYHYISIDNNLEKSDNAILIEQINY